MQWSNNETEHCLFLCSHLQTHHSLTLLSQNFAYYLLSPVTLLLQQQQQHSFSCLFLHTFSFTYSMFFNIFLFYFISQHFCFISDTRTLQTPLFLAFSYYWDVNSAVFFLSMVFLNTITFFFFFFSFFHYTNSYHHSFSSCFALFNFPSPVFKQFFWRRNNNTLFFF